ncbi:unnamed protein product [Lymnaea stagnalis]|uniref:Protein MCM10 homolog n=1 Tax=Lymnaea stagnalis TaxID=6523 RepID=A0AAV2IAU2_LYMST
MKTRMEGRKMISVSKIHLKLKTPDLQGDWVTIAAVVGKTDSKSSSSGKPYSIWKLNDLEDLDNSVSFFLFGEVHKHLWKTDLGTVVGVLNPSIMDSMEKSNSEPAFTIKNVNQLMIMGKSKDLAWCVARTKAGNKCVKFINKKHGDFCAYHVAAEYRKTSAQRLELHGSIAGVRPKSFESKVFSKDCAYIYGGKVYSHQKSSSAKKKGVTLTKLQNTLSQGKHQKINTLSINNIKPEPLTPKQTGRIKEDPDDTFLDLISVPSPGSMNLVAFLKNKDSKRLVASNSDLKKGASVVEVTAKDLIKQHQQLMKQKRPEKRKASDILMDSSPVTSMAGSSGKSPPGSLITDPLKQVPTLGKGFYHGQEITLDVIPRTVSLADRIKLKAVAAIKQKGGLKKEDPNAVRKEECSDVDKIRKRAQDEYEKISSEVPYGVSKSVKEPPKKKSRLLGDVDLNSDDIKSILKAKSKHKGALAEAEAEREEVYFNELEKKEKLEEKLQSVTSIEIKVYTCKQCSYTAQSALESCKQENHTVVTSKSKKRFFMCKKCKNRTFVIGGKFPTESCRNCGTLSYEKTSMYKVRSGPKLDSEVLNIRGDEVKFLSSMDQKVFLNTVID